jgi:hypothetical protein
MHSCDGIDGMRLPADSEAINAKLQLWTNLFESGVCTLTPGKAVGKNSDFVPALCLPGSEVENMTENSTDGRADRVKNAKR